MYFLKLNQLATQKLLEIIAGTFQSVYINVADRYRVLSTKCRRHSLVTCHDRYDHFKGIWLFHQKSNLCPHSCWACIGGWFLGAGGWYYPPAVVDSHDYESEEAENLWSKSRDRSGLLCHTTFDDSNMNLGQRSNNQILSKLFTTVLCMRKSRENSLRIHDRSKFIIRFDIFYLWFFCCVLRIWPHSEINCHVLVSRVTILCHQWHDDPVAHSQLCHPLAYLFIFRFLKNNLFAYFSQ